MLEILSGKKDPTIFGSQNTISLLSLECPECKHLHKKASLWICNTDLHTGNSCDLLQVTLTSFYSLPVLQIGKIRCPTCPTNRLLMLMDKNGHFEVFLSHTSIFTEDVGGGATPTCRHIL